MTHCLSSASLLHFSLHS
uniref:Uncharacterized protein n=1 Tax=Anguilla anguilla TaxID=7936 RepID=A0A0E9TY27_ANGAN